MIDPTSLKRKDYGRAVVYRSKGQEVSEKGIIVSANKQSIMVYFGKSMAKPCDPLDLDFTNDYPEWWTSANQSPSQPIAS